MQLTLKKNSRLCLIPERLHRHHPRSPPSSPVAAAPALATPPTTAATIPAAASIPATGECTKDPVRRRAVRRRLGTRWCLFNERN